MGGIASYCVNIGHDARNKGKATLGKGAEV